MLVVYMRNEKRMPVGESRADQVRIGLFSRQATQHRHRRVTQKSDNYVRNALKAEACLFSLWNETCSCCKNVLAQEKKLTGDNLKRKEATPTLKMFTVIQRLFKHLSFLPSPLFLFYFTLSRLPFLLALRGIDMADVPISSLGWKKKKKVSYSTLKCVVQKWFPSSEMSCNMWGLAFLRW